MQIHPLIEGYAFTIQNFLSPSECQLSIQSTEQLGYTDAPVTTHLGPMMLPMVRNNTRVMVDDLPLAQKLWSRFQPLAPDVPGWKAIGLNERFRYYRYDPGESFKPHSDGAFVRNAHERSMFTILLYLNEGFSAGDTVVNGLSVRPQTGMALVFLHRILHESTELLQGRKYVMRSDIMYHRA